MLPAVDPMTKDPARSYEPVELSDLERLARIADVEPTLFQRNPRLEPWRSRVTAIALAQGSAEHYIRGKRGIWDLDVIVCFASDPTLPRLFRRNPTVWDWGPSKFGRCPLDDLSLTGRAVDVMFWVIPPGNPVEAIPTWLAGRKAKKLNALTSPDLAHEPVVLIRPELVELCGTRPMYPLRGENFRPRAGPATGTRVTRARRPAVLRQNPVRQRWASSSARWPGCTGNRTLRKSERSQHADSAPSVRPLRAEGGRGATAYPARGGLATQRRLSNCKH